jgi:tetratricopeptide (TPR) repeat protein
MRATPAKGKDPRVSKMISFTPGSLLPAAARDRLRHLASHRRFLVISSLAILAVIAAVVCVHSGASDDRLLGVRSIVALSREIPFRSTEARLTGGFPYQPMRRVMDGMQNDSVWRLRRIAASGTPSDAHNTVAEELHVRGAAQMVLGDSQAAVALLERAIQKATGELDVGRAVNACNDGELLADLAAAYHARSMSDHAARDRVASLEVAEDAWRLVKSPETAWNRAIAVESLYLRPEAVAAWREYLDLDANSEWSNEARYHLQSLAAQPDAWEATRVRLDRQLPVQARGVADRLCKYVEEELLPQWAEAVESDRPEVASVILGRADSAAQQLCEQTGECVPLDSVRRVADLVVRDAVRMRVIANGFRAWTAATRAGKQKPDLRLSLLLKAAIAFRESSLPLAARVEMRVASSHFDANNFTAGLAKVRAIAEAYPEPLSRSPLLRGQVGWLRGMFLIATGHPGEALPSYQQALAEFTSISVETSAGMIELLIAENLSHMGEMDEAWEYYLRSIDQLGRAAEPLRLITALGSAGKIAAREKNDRVALVLDEAALTIARHERQAEYECQALVSRALIGSADAFKEERYVREAEEAWSRIPDEPTRRRFAIELEMARSMSVARNAPERAVHILTGARDMAIEYRDPFRYARVHLMRAQLYESLKRAEDAEMDLRAGIAEIELQRADIADDGLRARFIETGDELFSALAANLTARGRVADALDVAEQRRARVLRERLHPSKGLLPESEHVIAIQSRLPADAAIIEYSWSSNEVLFFVLTRQSIMAGHIPASRVVERALRRLEETARQDEASDLYDLVLRVVPLDGVRHLLIVPDGPLSRVPFAMLYDRREHRYLIEKCAISVIPSAAFAVDGRSALGPPGSILMVSEPKVASQYASAATLLPGARRETMLAKSFAHSVVLQGEAATVSNFVEAAANSDIIHFAGHALGGSDTHAAALALAPDATFRDGLLRIDDIERRGFHDTRLVVLAACSTSAGRSGGEGTMSLARAFLASGARSVVASLQPVDDEATAELWPVFYEEVRRGVSPAYALRDAQLNLMRHVKYSDPRYWAVFQVTGPV